MGGMSGGPQFIPPELLMNMMNDLTRGNLGDNLAGFSGNTPPPQASRAGPYAAPTGVEGFMMFVDGNPTMTGSARPQPPY